MFGQIDGSLDQYINTCDVQGQPTRRRDGLYNFLEGNRVTSGIGQPDNLQPIQHFPTPGSCTVNATEPPLTGDCNASKCPFGCVPCDETDTCYRKFHEMQCNMVSHGEAHYNSPNFNFCLETCTLSEGATYATWSRQSEICM